MYIYVDENTKSVIKRLQEHNHEFNGKLKIDASGNVVDIEYQAGQYMDSCEDYCVNFHTHPTDYTSLYPDHPSATDYKYIFNATCVQRKLIVHLIFTPKYIYAISFSCGVGILNYLFIYSRIQSIFDRLAKKYDRSTETFRLAYIDAMSKIGFTTRRYQYVSDIRIDISKKPSFSLIKQVILIIFIFVLLTQSEKNMK